MHSRGFSGTMPSMIKNMTARRFASGLALWLIFMLAEPVCRATTPEQDQNGSWTGYLMDHTCARERKDTDSDLGPRHTLKCLQMPACERSGYGLLTDKNEFLPFDEGGNNKVRALLLKTHKESGFRAVVRGTRADSLLIVKKIEAKDARR